MMLKKNSIIIAPSILSCDLSNIEKEVKAIEQAGADWIHVDVMDGHFVPQITFGTPIVRHLQRITNLPLDVHLMVQNPERHIENFAQSGASSLTVHEEAISDPNIIKNIKKLNVYSGLSIKPKTSIEKVLPYLEDLDYVLIMTVEPGKSGQKLIPEAASKVKHLSQIIRQKGFDIPIQVDGGIRAETIEQVSEAQIFVAGHSIFKSSDYHVAISQLKSKINR